MNLLELETIHSELIFHHQEGDPHPQGQTHWHSTKEEMRVGETAHRTRLRPCTLIYEILNGSLYIL